MAVAKGSATPPDLLWRRVGAGAIDLGLVLTIAVLAAVLVDGWLAAVLALAYQLVALVWLQGRTGASPGKQLVGLRVVDQTGQPCGAGKALVRWLCWAVPRRFSCGASLWWLASPGSPS